MSDNKRTDGGVILAVVLIVIGAWLLMGRVFGDWWGPVREVFRFVANLGFPLALIGIGVLVLLAAQGKLGNFDFHGRRLYRSRRDRMLSGVLGGLGELLGVDSTILRIAYVIFGFASGGGAIVLYIVATIVIPEEPVGQPAAPAWPGQTVGRETVQTPGASVPPAPPVPEPPAAPQPPSAPEPPA